MGTGAAGFMGKHLVRHLAALGVPVRATDLPRKDTSYFDELNVEFLAADLTKPETLPVLFDGEVDRVFHLGAICNFSTPYKKFYPTNVQGVDSITKLALAAGVRRYVHVGSTSVYGPYRGTPFTEEHSRNPHDAYGRSKRDGEDVVWRRIEQGLAAIVTRPCTVYGPGCNDGAGKVFSRPTAIRAIPGNGCQLLSSVRAEDVAAAAVHLSLLDEAVGRAFNTADDSHPTVEEALIIAATTLGGRPPTRHLTIPVVKALARVDGFVSKLRSRMPDLESDAVRYLAGDYVVDNTALKSTGYKLAYPGFNESMEQIGEWHGTDRTRISP